MDHDALVRYDTDGNDWRLSISDSGIGRRDLHQAAHPGLGTSIVEALARQLYARVIGPQGTMVSIIREARESVPANAMVLELSH